jgi:regulator of sirC expression with transglutaminase-like and TPR domain
LDLEELDMPKDTVLAAFAREVDRPDADIDLSRAALLMGRFEYPDLDVPAYEGRLDSLAMKASRLITQRPLSPVALAEYLFDTLGFAGNEGDYLDPRNSFLNEVLERRLGIPITLSVLYVEVARRLGMDARGVGLPGHFIVRVNDERGIIYLDPFHRGAQMTLEDCVERVRTVTKDQLPFDPAYLNPVGARYILMRMLNNLKNVYTNANDYERARHIVERLLALSPDNLDEVRNLGLLYSALGQNRRAVELLTRYLQGRPGAPDADTVKQYIVALSGNMARWN